MITILVDDINGKVDMIKCWAEQFKDVKIERFSSLITTLSSEELGQICLSNSYSYKGIADYCKKNDINLFVSFKDLDNNKGESNVLIDKKECKTDTYPKNVKPIIFSEKDYKYYGYTNSYFNVPEGSDYKMIFLNNIERIYSLEKISQVSPLSDVVQLETAKSTNDKLKDMIKKSKTKAKKKRGAKK